MRFDRILLFCKHLTSAKKVEAFVKSQDQLKRKGCLVIIFGPRNDTRSTRLDVHLVKKEHSGNGALEHVLILLCFVYNVYHKNNVPKKNKSPYSSFILIFSLGAFSF